MQGVQADDTLRVIVGQASSSGILTDFDGTMAPIVDDPAVARPLAAVPELLAAFARRYRRVAVLSGRPVAFLEGLLPPTVVLSGLYGLEVSHEGRRHDHPQSGAWREVVADVAATARASGPVGMRTESKGLSLTLHYREHPELADEVRGWGDRQAARSGLVSRPARMSVELHPPIGADKGTAVDELAKGLTGLVYVGDDRGDFPAFDALERLGAAGVAVVKVAVTSDEAPPGLLERADIVVDGPAGAVELLGRMLTG